MNATVTGTRIAKTSVVLLEDQEPLRLFERFNGITTIVLALQMTNAGTAARTVYDDAEKDLIGLSTAYNKVSCHLAELREILNARSFVALIKEYFRIPTRNITLYCDNIAALDTAK